MGSNRILRIGAMKPRSLTSADTPLPARPLHNIRTNRLRRLVIQHGAERPHPLLFPRAADHDVVPTAPGGRGGIAQIRDHATAHRFDAVAHVAVLFV